MPAPARPAPALTPAPHVPSITAPRPMLRFGAADMPRILEHLHALDADDRLLRFSHGIRDEGIAAYVASLDFARDHVHGLCTAQGDIVALAHVAVRDGEVDFGLSVIAAYRQRGLGRALFGHVIALARLHDAVRIVCHSVSPAVLHMAAASGFRRPGGCHTAPLTLELRAASRCADDAPASSRAVA
ncbi:GNAT family N-acetyltransferase [Thauera humireducens]|uniref:GCN5 family acetyltransferase n=1 Tax=Thauera humireducens TaxID=1134435 RepID=A0A127K5H3_9RHOO|nr:GNAT family N-acetyltransferase [Thauera humireducens]AMO37206.1 GCN5 family acetyltransferase [Thauera humireducens]